MPTMLMTHWPISGYWLSSGMVERMDKSESPPKTAAHSSMPQDTPSAPRESKHGATPQNSRLHRLIEKAVHFGADHIPAGARLIAGLILMIGGVFGFLPILGFWMIPLGAVIAALDIPPLRRRLYRRYPRRRNETKQNNSPT